MTIRRINEKCSDRGNDLQGRERSEKGKKCEIDVIFGIEGAMRAKSVCVNGCVNRKGGCGDGGGGQEGVGVNGGYGLLLVATGVAGVVRRGYGGGDGDVQFLKRFVLAARDSFVSEIGGCERDIRGGVLNGPFPVDFG